MQYKLLKSLFLAFSLFFCLSANAQPPNGRGKPDGKKVDALRIAFITEKLQLTTQEAQVFWPVYNEYQGKLKEIRQQGKFEDLTDASTDADITVEFDDGRIMLNAQSGNSVAATVRAYPNPVTDNVEIKFNAEQEQNCLVKLMDVTGRQIAEHTITVTKGSNEFQLDLKFLAPGIYAMQLMIDGKTESVRLIKN